MTYLQKIVKLFSGNADCEKWAASTCVNVPQDYKYDSSLNWREAGVLHVTHGSIWIGDLFIADAADGYMQKFPNGRFRVEVQQEQLHGHISAIRVLLEKNQTHELGKKVADISTDQATVGICDMNAMDIVVGNDDAFQAIVEDAFRRDYGSISIKLNGECTIFYSSSGSSDGVFPVYELLSEAGACGLLVEFFTYD